MINEDDSGGFGSAGMMSPYGFQYTTPDMLYKAFVKPFVDVGQVAAGKTKEVSQSAQTLVKTALTALATSIIPVLSSDYEDIFKKSQANMQKIRQEYGEVYQATWDAFKDADIVTMAFMYDPGAVLTGALAKKSLKTTGKLLSVLSGGELDDYLKKVSTRFGDSSKSRKNDWSSPLSMPMPESRRLVKEAGDKKPVADFLTDPRVVKKAVESPKAQQMRKAAGETVRKLLEEIYKKSQAVTTANSIQDLQSKLGVKLKGVAELQKIPENERAEVEKQLLATVKKSMLSFYTKNVQKIIKDALDAGIPQDSQFVKDFATLAQKLKA